MVIKIMIYHLSLPSRERGLKSDNFASPDANVGSLPSRERGLKFIVYGMKKDLTQSLPSRERGLKFCTVSKHQRQQRSLPSRERGLKCAGCASLTLIALVAPLAGAWIEMRNENCDVYIFLVAPLAGAWIEIRPLRTEQLSIRSLPSRERGLKYVQGYAACHLIRRSPRGSVD